MSGTQQPSLSESISYTEVIRLWTDLSRRNLSAKGSPPRNAKRTRRSKWSSASRSSAGRRSRRASSGAWCARWPGGWAVPLGPGARSPSPAASDPLQHAADVDSQGGVHGEGPRRRHLTLGVGTTLSFVIMCHVLATCFSNCPQNMKPCFPQDRRVESQ